MLSQRGIIVSYEAIRYWCRKFGPGFARSIRKRQRDVSDQWHVDEVFLRIKGRIFYLFRAVDQDGQVLDILLQSRRNKRAALKFFRKLLKQQGYAPRILVTDKLRSYSAAHQERLSHSAHHTHRWANNRMENSHQPTRQRERRMRRFKSQAKPNGFCQSREPSMPSSAQAVISLPPQPIGRYYVSNSLRGTSWLMFP